MRAITQYLKAQGFGVVDDSYYSHIALWGSWYRGKVATFHNYRQYNGKRKVNRTRKTLGMAKAVSEDWANLLLNEKVLISTGETKADKIINTVLTQNDFLVRGNQLVELAMGLGTGAFVEYKDGDDVKIDYIRAGMIYPLSWENGVVEECAFASEKAKGNQKHVYLNIHSLNEAGNYVIENKMFIRNGQTLTPTELPDGVLDIVNTNSPIPRFQLIKPNIVNNVDLDCPMGISVFANAIDQLEGCDLVYDSYCNEFRLGKKRVIVPTTMARMMMEDDGDVTPMFDDNDVEFYALQMGEGADQKLTEISMDIRSEDHDRGMDKTLALLSKKCGFGNNHYKFENGTVKTATEVISEKSDMFQNLKKHEIILGSAITNLIQSIATLSGINLAKDITINFDDSIIEDSAAERLRDQQEVRDGLMQKWEYRVKWYGETEEEAKKMLEGMTDEAELFGSGGGGNA